MQELAGRLNSSRERDTLLRGVKPTTPSRAPLPGSTTSEASGRLRSLPPGESSPGGQALDLRQLIEEELEKQRQAEQQRHLQEQELRRLIAAEVSRLAQSTPAPATRQPQPQTAGPAEPSEPEPAMTEQDLRALIAQELARQGQPLPQPQAEQPVVAGPVVQTPAVAEPTVPTPANQENDLQALIAREMARRRQTQPEQPAVPEPDETPAVTEDVGSDRPVMDEAAVRALIAAELNRQNQGTPQPATPAPVVPPPTAQRTQPQETDLQTLIAQEMERRRQRAQQPTTPQAPPFLVGSRPSTSGVSPVTGLAPDNRAALRAYRDIQIQRGLADPDEPWSLGADLDKYRAYAVAEGSRNTGESLKKAVERLGLTLEDGANILTLGYASKRGEPFRHNDGKGLFQEPGNVPRQAGRTLVDFGDGLYSLIDLVLLDALADKNKDAYQDNNALLRPFVYTGKTIGGLWRTGEELGNAITWGYFDNLTGSAGMCFEDIIETLKHTGQAVTNVARAPVHMLGGKDSGLDKALDWVLLVPLEMASNIVEMKGISNMDDYRTAFADKGVIGSILEFGGSTFVIYYAIDELADELNGDNGTSSTSQASAEAPAEPPPAPEPPAPVIPEVPVEPIDAYFYWALR